MAATNYTPIQLYFSTTASAVPLAANLAQGELAINITDGKLYYEDNAGVVQVIATKGAGTIGGSTTQIQYNNAGALAGNAAMTFNSGTNTTTLTTLNLTNALGATYGGTAQSAYAQGDFLYASATNTLSKLSIGTVNYILTSSGSVPQWSAPSSIIVQTATNLAGGLGGSVPYQSAVDTTTFLAIGAANRVMTSSGTAPQWVTSLSGLTGVSSSSITNTSLTSGRVVVSTTAGLQADDADLTFDGTTLSAGGFSTVGLSTLVKTVKIGDSSFNGVAVFAAATPAKLYIGTGTVTDTTSAIGATNAVGAVSSLAITPIAATNTSVTYTNAATLYIAGAPSAGTNVTLTNPYALYVAAGDAYFGGTVTAGTVNLTTLDLTNLEVTNIKAKDGTAAMTIADSTGVVSFTANPVLSGGTANGVAYLDGSKVLTTGSALTFDGTDFSNTAGKVIAGGDLRATITGTGNVGLNIARTGGTTADWYNYIPSGSADLAWFKGSEQMRLTSTGLGIGTSSPTLGLTVEKDNGSGYIAAFRANNTSPYLTIQTTSSITQIQGINSAFSATNDIAMQLSGGNVGIGTSSPTQKLDVAGTVRIVETTTPIGDAALQISVDGTNARTIRMTDTGSSGKTFDFINRAQGVAGNFGFFDNTAGAYRYIIDSSGNLGLGVTPSAWGASRSAIETGALGYLVSSGSQMNVGQNNYFNGTNFIYKTTGAATIYQQISGAHYWNIAASGTAGDPITFTQAMTLDANGNLVIGDTSTSSGLTLVRSGSTTAELKLNQTGTGGRDYRIGSTGSGYGSAGNLIFYDATASAERARIDSSGNLLVGRTSSIGGARVSAETATTTPTYAAYLPTTGTETAFLFVNPNGTVGSITTNGSATLYNVTSDQRLKENIQDAAPASALIDALQVREYDWKSDGSHQRYGFVAQELVAVAPEAVHQPADPEDMMAVDYSKLVPMLVKEIQDLRKRVSALEPTGFVQSFLP